MRFLRTVLAALCLSLAAACTGGLPTAPSAEDAGASYTGQGLLGGGTR